MTLSMSQSAGALYKPTERVPAAPLSADLMTVADVAAFLKLPKSWIYERTRRSGAERIPHFKLGKYLRFSQREVLDWLQIVRGI